MPRALAYDDPIEIPMCICDNCEIATECMRHITLGVNTVVPDGYVDYSWENLAYMMWNAGCPDYMSCWDIDGRPSTGGVNMEPRQVTEGGILVSEDTLMNILLTPMNQGVGVGGLYGAEECPYCGSYNDGSLKEMVHMDNCPIGEIGQLDWVHSTSKMYITSGVAEAILRLSPVVPAYQDNIIIGCECIYCKEVGTDQWGIEHSWGCPIAEMKEVCE